MLLVGDAPSDGVLPGSSTSVLARRRSSDSTINATRDLITKG